MNLYAEAFDLVGALRRGEKTSDAVALAVVGLADGDVDRARAVLADAVAGRERLARIAEEDRLRPRADGRPGTFAPGGEGYLAEQVAEARRARAS